MQKKFPLSSGRMRLRSNDVLAIAVVILFIVAIWAVIPDQEKINDQKIGMRIKEKLALERPDIIDDIYKVHIEDFFRNKNEINAKIAISYIESYIRKNGFSESAYSDISMLWSFMKKSDKAIEYLFKLYKEVPNNNYLNKLIDNILWSRDPLQYSQILKEIIPKITDPLVFQRLESVLENNKELNLIATFRYCELFPKEALATAERFIDDSQFEEAKRLFYILRPDQKRYIERKIFFRNGEYKKVISMFQTDTPFNDQDIMNYLFCLYYQKDFNVFLKESSVFMENIDSEELLYDILEISELIEPKLFLKSAEKIMKTFPKNKSVMQYRIYQFYYRMGDEEKALNSLRDFGASSTDILNVLLSMDLNGIEKDILISAINSLDTDNIYKLLMQHKQLIKELELSRLKLKGEFKPEILYLYGEKSESAKLFEEYGNYLRAFDVYIELGKNQEAIDILLKKQSLFDKDQIDLLLSRVEDEFFLKLFKSIKNKGFYSYNRFLSLTRDKEPTIYKKTLNSIMDIKDDKRYELLFMREKKQYPGVIKRSKALISEAIQKADTDEIELDYYIDSLFTSYISLGRFKEAVDVLSKYNDIISDDSRNYFRFSYSMSTKNYKDALAYMKKSNIPYHYYDEMVVYIENNMPEKAYKIISNKYLQEKNKKILRQYWGYFSERESGIFLTIPSRQNGIRSFSISNHDFYRNILIDIVNLRGDDVALSSFSRDLIMLTYQKDDKKYFLSSKNDDISIGASYTYRFGNGELEFYIGDIGKGSNLSKAAFKNNNGIRYLRELKVDSDEYSTLSFSYEDSSSLGERYLISAYYEKLRKEGLFNYLSVDIDKFDYDIDESDFDDLSILNTLALREYIRNSVLDESVVLNFGIRRESYFKSGFFRLSMGLYYDILNNVGGPSITLDYLRKDRFFIKLSGGYSSEGEKVIDLKVGKRYE